MLACRLRFVLTVLASVILGIIPLTASLANPEHPLQRSQGSTLDEGSAGASMCYGNRIDVGPTRGDRIDITPSGTWCDGCVPRYQFYQIMGPIIRIFAEAEPPGSVCAMVVLPWKFTVSVGPLSMGSYTAEVYISRYGPAPIFHQSTFFLFIPENMNRYYLPVIAK